MRSTYLFFIYLVGRWKLFFVGSGRARVYKIIFIIGMFDHDTPKLRIFFSSMRAFIRIGRVCRYYVIYNKRSAKSNHRVRKNKK